MDFMIKTSMDAICTEKLHFRPTARNGKSKGGTRRFAALAAATPTADQIGCRDGARPTRLSAGPAWRQVDIALNTICATGAVTIGMASLPAGLRFGPA
jgi:hypothetical protein